jgi:hypothetical protein
MVVTGEVTAVAGAGRLVVVDEAAEGAPLEGAVVVATADDSGSSAAPPASAPPRPMTANPPTRIHHGRTTCAGSDPVPERSG